MFQVSFRDNTVRVTEKENDIGAPIYEIELLNGSGEVVESFDDELLDKDDGTNGSIESWYSIIHELYNTARRTALGAEKVLDEIIADLDDIMPF
ncbi:hypothetical protein CQW49_05050 [Methylosinus trichosporium OB3b]|uniref:Uncharacterized protein n=2 Tax=Methylocystaceae TaxID=31993 RepID=A0A2D2CX46_METT3|nr:hypothetical protein CQW49_05050 [Methylosinus trichosporium OB3b]